MLEIKSKKYSVKIEGQVYELAPLKVFQIREIEKDKDNIGLDHVVKFISEAGLPKEVIENLDGESLGSIVKLLAGKK